MLLFSVDSRRLFRQGQHHELKILFQRNKNRAKNLDTASNSSSERSLIGTKNARHGSTQNSLYGSHSSRLNHASNSNNIQNHQSARPAPTIHYSNNMAHPGVTIAGLNLGGRALEPVSQNHHIPGGGRPIPPERRRRRNSSASIRSRRNYGIKKTFPVDESSLSVASIIIRCDSITGKFGFNVKGGADQNQPLLVSRVASGTPADRCYPRLNEGDQVVLINGRDVSDMSHEEVVTLIRSSREAPLGELRLTVKQNVYEPEGLDEPSFQYVPETIPEGGINPVGGMAESLLLLSEGLEAGSLVSQFDQCYRRKPGMDMLEARKAENEKKNRYRDISPYDVTRVMLHTSLNGDYINGSHVRMTIPTTNIANHYIACQGPLSSTAEDFWRMVWEQGSKLVVMLTTVVEQGRIKCYRYWPQHCDFVEFGFLKITCLKEEETPGFAYREFVVTNTENHESRSINHMQYLAWPDHGVPDDSMEFLNFVSRVRQTRKGVSAPTIVHCSAGIGRTGVLILMETAQCLIEANQPIYPLDIVRTMRDQRAMMIQTASQYRFVCEAICRVYMEGLVRPLSENGKR